MSIFAYEIAKIWIDMELYNVQLRTDLDEVVVAHPINQGD